MSIRRFSYFLFFTVSLVWTLDGVIYYGLSYFQDRNYYGMSGGLVNYYLNHEEVDILIVGSSRAHHHVIPDSLCTSAFNLSHNGMGFGFHVGLLDHLSQQQVFPEKLVLLQIEPEDFFKAKEKVNLDFHYLNNYYHQNDFIRDNIDALGVFESNKYLFKSYSFNGKVPSLIKNYLRSGDQGAKNGLGFKGHPVSIDNDKVNEFRKNLVVDFQKKMTPYSVYLLNHLVDLCEQNGVELVFFTSPYFTSPIKEPNETFEHLLVGLQARGIRYVDFTRASQILLQESKYWKDNYHLNIDGAKIFSGMLRDSLNCEQMEPDK